MRKLTFFILALAAMTAVFTSCKKSTNASPVIGITNTADSVTSIAVTGDSYTLTLQITSEAGLDKVVISETRGGTKTDKSTITTFTDKNAYTGTYTVSSITANVIVTISATDKDAQNTTREIILTKSGTALTTVTFTAYGDASNTGNVVGAGKSKYGSYVDLDGGKIYLSGDAKGSFSSTIDVIFDNLTLSNNDATSSSPGFAGGTGTYLKVVTGVTYATATSSTLSGLSVTTSDKTAAVTSGAVIYFETTTNKGLLDIVSLNAKGSDTDEITVEAKIMAK